MKLASYLLAIGIGLLPYLVAIGAGLLLGFAVVFANPECYQVNHGVTSFHPTVLLGAMMMAGVLTCKFKSLRNAFGIIVTMTIVAFPVGIVATGMVYSSWQMSVVGLIIGLASFGLSKTMAMPEKPRRVRQRTSLL